MLISRRSHFLRYFFGKDVSHTNDDRTAFSQRYRGIKDPECLADQHPSPRPHGSDPIKSFHRCSASSATYLYRRQLYYLSTTVRSTPAPQACSIMVIFTPFHTAFDTAAQHPRYMTMITTLEACRQCILHHPTRQHAMVNTTPEVNSACYTIRVT